MINWFKSWFCKHEYYRVGGVYGDEIIRMGYKRSIWKCKKCNKRRTSNSLNELT